MNLKETESAILMERRAAIVKESETATGDDLAALEKEMDEINAELETRKADEAKKNEARKAVANGAGQTIEKIEERNNGMSIKEIRNSREYINAFAEYIKTGKDEEVRALLSTNATTSTGYVPVPEIVEQRIRTAWAKLGLMELVTKTALKGNVKVGFELSATDAAIHAEGANAPAEETLTFGVIEMKPESIKKWIDREAA